MGATVQARSDPYGGSDVCPSGAAWCGGKCVDLVIIPSNCGSCGRVLRRDVSRRPVLEFSLRRKSASGRRARATPTLAALEWGTRRNVRSVPDPFEERE